MAWPPQLDVSLGLAGAADDGPAVTAMIDAVGTVLWVGGSVRRVFGWAPEDLVGRPAVEMIHPDDAPRVAAGLAEAAHTTGHRPPVTFRFRSAEGGWRHVEAGLVNRLGDPQVGAFVMQAWDVTDREQARAQHAEQALRDPLTGLANRTLFLDRLEQALARTDRSSLPLAVLYLDVDGFKELNDTHGHLAGDRTLQVIARRLAAAVRPMDTTARLGGDEFVVLCEALDHRPPAATDGPGRPRCAEADLARALAHAEHLAARVLASVHQPLPPSESAPGAAVVPRISVGGTVTANPEHRPLDLLARADAAMYEAKRGQGANPRLHLA